MFDSTGVWRVGLLCAVSACASVSGVQLATPIAPGMMQVGIEPGLQALNTAAVYPHFDLALRYGLTPRVEVGARTGWSFLEAQAKVLLTSPEQKRFAVSLVPTMGGVFVPAQPGASSSGLLHVATPVLFGISFGAHQLVIGVRSQHFLVLPSAAPAYLLGVGGSVGFGIRLNASLVVMPEVGVLVPVFGGLSRVDTDGVPRDIVYGMAGIGITQLKLGFLLDRQR